MFAMQPCVRWGLLLAAALSAQLAAAQPLRVHGAQAAAPKQAITALAHRAPPGSAGSQLVLRPLPPAQMRPAAGAGNEKALQIGLSRAVATEAQGDPAVALHWEPAADGVGLTARVVIMSPGAGALRAGLASRSIPPDAQLRFYSSRDPARVIGPIAGEELAEAVRMWGIYWSPVTDGDTQVVELWVGSSAQASSAALRIETVSHIFPAVTDLAKDATGAGAAQPCHEDVACVEPANPDLARNIRSVMKLVFTRNGATFLCTGTLINDAQSSQVPYVYTAAHCIDSQASAASLNTIWHFQSGTCGGMASAQYEQLAGGATLLFSDADSDGALLRLADRAPDGAWFSGWDATPLEAATDVVALHHPRGDLKKLAVGSAVVSPTPLYSTVAWRVGATEPGSSGSGLFTKGDGEYVLRGGLRGGASSCQTSGNVADPSDTDLYSRLDRVAPLLKQWLAPAPVPAEDFSGMWYDTQEPGWGVGIAQSPAGRTFVTWYTYGVDGMPTWLVAPEPSWNSATSLEGTLYRTAGSPYAATYDPSRFALIAAGTIRIDFAHGTASATLVLDGKPLAKPLVRMAL
ncbi:MAG TPA: serine protease [Usitatibacter sp.]|jgi:hypothetical protein|nr:serine protease [Usitatibacter sp.]